MIGCYSYFSDFVQPVIGRKSISVVISDIDFFKKINDTYGHIQKCIKSLPVYASLKTTQLRPDVFA